jgi:hypothetical protein
MPDWILLIVFYAAYGDPNFIVVIIMEKDFLLRPL